MRKPPIRERYLGAVYQGTGSISGDSRQYIRGQYTYLVYQETVYLFDNIHLWRTVDHYGKLVRLVILHVAHHVPQRGNLCLPVFFYDADQEV